MSEIKFSCPACGQHISCSTAYCDSAIHCPNCRTEIRVPCSPDFNKSSEPPKLKLQSSTNSSNQPASVGVNGIGKTAPAANEKELHCRCPVCQSNLRIPASAAAQSDGVFPPAELVLKPGEKKDHSPQPDLEPAAVTPVMTEREQKIAAERAARAVSLYPKMKPRLDLVLGEKPSPEPKDEENPPWMKEAA